MNDKNWQNVLHMLFMEDKKIDIWDHNIKNKLVNILIKNNIISVN